LEFILIVEFTIDSFLSEYLFYAMRMIVRSNLILENPSKIFNP